MYWGLGCVVSVLGIKDKVMFFCFKVVVVYVVLVFFDCVVIIKKVILFICEVVVVGVWIVVFFEIFIFVFLVWVVFWVLIDNYDLFVRMVD